MQSTGTLMVTLGISDESILTPEQRVEWERTKALSGAFALLSEAGYLVVPPHDTRRLGRYKVADYLRIERYSWLDKSSLERLIPVPSESTGE